MAARRRSQTIQGISARTSSDFIVEAGFAVLHALKAGNPSTPQFAHGEHVSLLYRFRGLPIQARYKRLFTSVIRVTPTRERTYRGPWL